MLPETKQIKRAARSVFKENAVGALTVSFGVFNTIFIGYFIAYLISVFSGMLGFLLFELLYVYLIVLPVFLGAIRYFSIIIERKNVKPIEIFYYFSSFKIYKRAFLFVSSIFFVVLGTVILVLFIPFVLMLISAIGFYSIINISAEIFTPMFKTASLFLEMLGIGLVILMNIKYYLAIYFFVCNDDLPVRKAVRFSINISRKTRFDFWLLIFSMIVYILLSLPVLPLFFIMPYFMLSYVVHGKCCAIQYNESIDVSNKQFTVVAR